MKKKIAVILTCACMVFGTGLSVNAAEVPTVSSTTSISPRMQQCGNCGKNTLHNSKTYTQWVLTGQQKCSKEWNRSDDVYQRKVHTWLVCSNCKYSTHIDEKTETKVVCTHK